MMLLTALMSQYDVHFLDNFKIVIIFLIHFKIQVSEQTQTMLIPKCAS